MLSVRENKIIFINRFFWPDESATSRMLSDLAVRMAGDGLDVHVIASRQTYTDSAADLSAEELHESVKVHRVWTTSFGRMGLLGRAFDYLSFYVTAFIRLLLVARCGDRVVAKTDPPMMACVAALACSFRRARLTHWMQDIFPEIAIAGLSNRRVMRVLEPLKWMRDLSMRPGDSVVTLGGEMRKYVEGRCSSEVVVIGNWAARDEISPVDRSDNPLCEEWGLEDDFVLGYSGNLGRAHDVDTFCDACERLSGDTKLLFIGGGSRLQRIINMQRSGLRNLQLRDYQPRERLSESLSLPDVHWLSLKPELGAYVFPSKLYGIAAAGRPCIFVGRRDSELGRLVEEEGMGISVESGDADAFVKAVGLLRRDPEKRHEMGKRARAWFERNGEFDKAYEAWYRLLA